MRGLRRRGDRGAAAVEFALLLPPFVVLAVGTISAGFVFHDWLTLTQGAREAARYAATLDVAAADPVGTDGWLGDVESVARVASEVSSSNPGQRVCVALFYGDTWYSQGSPTGPSAPCWDDDRPDTEERVQVEVGKDANFNWVFGDENIELGTRTVTRYEHGVSS